MAEEDELRRRIIQLLVRDLPEEDYKWLRLGRHLLKVKNSYEHCLLLSRAGDVHRQSFDAEQAFQCYTKVLDDLQDQTDEEADRLYVETSIKFSKVSTARQDTGQVLDTLRHALARAGDNISHQALLEMHLAKNEWLRGGYDPAMEHFERGWALAKDLDDQQVVNSITNFGTFFLFWQGRFKEAVESYERSVSDVEHYPKSRFPLVGAITVGYCYAQTGNHTQGLGMLDAIRSHCLKKGDLYLASLALGNIGIIMADLRKLDEAMMYIEQSVKMANETHNLWVWMSTQAALAFVCYLKGDKKRAVNHLEDFLNYSREAQTTVQLFPYLLALAWAVKQGELPEIRGLALENEIERMINSKNIFIRGMAKRYQAFLLDRAGGEIEEVVRMFEESIEYLSESGHQIELSRSRLELARFLLSKGLKDRPQKLTRQAFKVLGALDESLIPDDLRGLVGRDNQSDRLLEEMMQLSQELVKIRNNRDLAQRIISAGNRVTGAERGAIFMVDEEDSGCFQLRASKNLTSEQVGQACFEASMQMIRETVETGQGMITGAELQNGVHDSEGVIRSKICVPMTLHEKITGVLYHDNRLLSSAFKDDHLGILSYFAAQAAIALDNARAYEEIKRLNRKLHREKQYYEEEHLSYLHFDEIVGKSKEIKEVLAQVEQVAGTEATVLITGETGVGKELVARAIQRHGLRNDRPFIGVQLSTLPEELIASELLGHEKGSFTGATRRRIGRFELADGGTLFLDEIGDISLEIQVRLLRVLQTREFERVGGAQTLYSDFRLIAATNRDLVREIQESRFRADLYYRLNVFPIYVPPLRERREDIPLLARHFLGIHAAKLGKNVEHIPERVIKKLLNYDWPGNVRELQNVIERGVILSTGNEFRMPELGRISHSQSEGDELKTLEDIERRHITRILKEAGWRVSGVGGAAEILGLNPSTLSFRMKKLGIKRPKRPKLRTG